MFVAADPETSLPARLRLSGPVAVSDLSFAHAEFNAGPLRLGKPPRVLFKPKSDVPFVECNNVVESVVSDDRVPARKAHDLL
jgi:hypothetical protein